MVNTKTTGKLLLFLFLCIFLLGAKLPEKKPIDYEIYANQVTHDFIQEVKKNYQFSCAGSGGSMPYDIETIDIDFHAYQKATLEEARELEIELIDTFLRIINSYEKIRPFLREYPFPPERVYIGISFLNKWGNYRDVNSISQVSRGRDGIIYRLKDPKTFDSTELGKESLEEAYRMVQNTKGNSSNSQIKRKILRLEVSDKKAL